MQTNVDVIEEKNVVDIQDLSSFTLDINDATLSGTITVLDDKATFTDNTINTTTVVNTITLPSDSDTTIEIVSPIAEKISVEKLVTNVVEIDFANALFAQGQATTAERLQNPININGVSFDATQDINISNFTNSITASGDISASGTVFASRFESAGEQNQTISFNDNVAITGSITASHISASTITFQNAGSSPITAIELNNNNILGIGKLQWADPGVDEGLEWANWRIYESPNDLSNASGSLQIVTGDFGDAATRILTVHEYGIEVTGSGHITASGNISASGDLRARNIRLDDADGGVLLQLNSNSGDSIIRFTDEGTQKWDIGRDNTQQNLVISTDTGLGTNDLIVLTRDSNISFNGPITASGDISTSGSLFLDGLIEFNGDSEHRIERKSLSSFGIDTNQTTEIRGRNTLLYSFDDVVLRAGSSDEIRMFAGDDTNARLTIDRYGHISASGDISSSGTITANSLNIGSGTSVGSTITTTNVSASGFISASALDVSGSATLQGNLVFNGVSFTETAIGTVTGSHIFGSTNSNTHEFTGSISSTGNITTAATFSGHGGLITGIPADSVVGLNLSKIESGGISASVSATGLTVNSDVTASTFSGSGVGLTNIPASSVTGLNLAKIESGSISASVSATGLTVNSNITASGSISASGTISTNKLHINTTGENATGANAALFLESYNGDTSLRIGHNATITGFEIKYKGTDGGNNNDLEFLSDNVSAAGQIKWMNVKQDGQIALGSGSLDDGAGVIFLPGSGSVYAGNVGIGTASPGEKLQVAGNISATHITASGDIVFSGSEVVSIKNTGPSDDIRIIPNANLELGTVSTDQIYIGRTDNWPGKIRLRSGGSTTLTVTGSRVGIGTESPQAKVNIVSGDTMAWTNLASASLLIGTTDSGIGIDSNEIMASGNLYLGSKGSTGNVSIRAGGTSTRIFVSSSGNVGIGTTSPGYLLDVNGDAQIKGIWQFTDSGIFNFGSSYGMGTLTWDTGYASLYGQSGNRLRLGSHGTQGVMVVSSSMVGIGTETPSEKLTVEGNISASGVISGSNFFKDGSELITSASVSSSVSTINSSITNLSSSASSARTSLSSSIASTITSLSSSASSARTSLSSSVSTSITALQSDVDANETAANNAIALKANINNPEFTGNVTASNNILIKSANALVLNNDSDDQHFKIGNSTDNRLDFNDGTNTRMVISSSGNVGIGTTSPSEKLHVLGDIKIQTNTNAGVIHFGDTSDQTKIVGYDESYHDPRIDFFVSRSKKLTINNSGNVGIGIDSPGKALEVVGDISASGVISASNISLANGASLGSDISATNITASGVISASSVTASALFVSGSATLDGNLTFAGVSFTETNVATHAGNHVWGTDHSSSHYHSGSITASRNIRTEGTFSGRGDLLTNIPSTAITGLNLSRIASGSITASVSSTGLSVNSNISASDSASFGALTVAGKNIDPTGITRDKILKFNGTHFVSATVNQTFVFSIASFSDGLGTTFEAGTPNTVWKDVGEIAFTASYNNGPPSIAEIHEIDATENNYEVVTWASPYTAAFNDTVISYPAVNGTRQFKLTANGNITAGGLESNIHFRQYIYWGATAAETLTGAEIISEMTDRSFGEGESDISRIDNFINATGNKYIYYAQRTANDDINLSNKQFLWGTNTGNQVVMAFTKNQPSISHTNQSGLGETYEIYRSVNQVNETGYLDINQDRRNYIYYGATGSWVQNEDNIESLPFSTTSTGVPGALSIAAFGEDAGDPENKYVVVAYPKRAGEKLFTITAPQESLGNLSMQTVATQSITNKYGYTEDYYVYRSVQLLGYSETLQFTIT